MSASPNLDYLDQTILLEVISSVSKATEEAEIRSLDTGISDTQIETLNLHISFLTEKLAQLKARAENGEALIERMRRLTHQFQVETTQRREQILARDIERSQILAETIPHLRLEYDTKLLQAMELDRLIAVETDRNREMRSENTRLMAETATGRMHSPNLIFSDDHELAKRSSACSGLLKFLDPRTFPRDEARRFNADQEVGDEASSL